MSAGDVETSNARLTLLLSARPEDPLRVLGEFFLQRSRELEGTT